MTNFDDVEYRAVTWAADKGIFRESTVFKQYEKLVEEVKELSESLDKFAEDAASLEDIKYELGDCIVCLNNISVFLQTTIPACFDMAVSKIEKRKTKMEDGFVVKEGVPDE